MMNYVVKTTTTIVPESGSTGSSGINGLNHNHSYDNDTTTTATSLVGSGIPSSPTSVIVSNNMKPLPQTPCSNGCHNDDNTKANNLSPEFQTIKLGDIFPHLTSSTNGQNGSNSRSNSPASANCTNCENGDVKIKIESQHDINTNQVQVQPQQIKWEIMDTHTHTQGINNEPTAQPHELIIPNGHDRPMSYQKMESAESNMPNFTIKTEFPQEQYPAPTAIPAGPPSYDYSELIIINNNNNNNNINHDNSNKINNKLIPTTDPHPLVTTPPPTTPTAMVPGSLSCSLCFIPNFRNLKQYRKHMATNHSPTARYICEICDVQGGPPGAGSCTTPTKFDYRTSLVVHLERAHGKIEQQKPPVTTTPKRKLSSPPQVPIRPFPCHLCSCSYSKKVNLNAHKKKKHPDNLTTASSAMSNNNNILQNQSQIGEAILGIPSGWNTNPSIPVQNNQMSISIDTPETLSIPEAASTQNAGIGGYPCPQCPGRTFQFKNNLKAHLRTHARSTQYTCNQCSKSFIYKESLKNHMLLHSNELPYDCEVCGKKFRDRSNRRKHVKNVHKIGAGTNSNRGGGNKNPGPGGGPPAKRARRNTAKKLSADTTTPAPEMVKSTTSSISTPTPSVIVSPSYNTQPSNPTNAPNMEHTTTSTNQLYYSHLLNPQSSMDPINQPQQHTSLPHSNVIVYGKPNVQEKLYQDYHQQQVLYHQYGGYGSPQQQQQQSSPIIDSNSNTNGSSSGGSAAPNYQVSISPAPAPINYSNTSSNNNLVRQLQESQQSTITNLNLNLNLNMNTQTQGIGLPPGVAAYHHHQYQPYTWGGVPSSGEPSAPIYDHHHHLHHSTQNQLDQESQLVSGTGGPVSTLSNTETPTTTPYYTYSTIHPTDPNHGETMGNLDFSHL